MCTSREAVLPWCVSVEQHSRASASVPGLAVQMMLAAAGRMPARMCKQRSHLQPATPLPAQTVEWGLSMLPGGGHRLREAERAAKQAKLGAHCPGI